MPRYTGFFFLSKFFKIAMIFQCAGENIDYS